jgi:chemotaxis protein MotB
MLILMSTGCVSAGTYDQAVSDAVTRMRAANASSAAELAKKDTELAKLSDALLMTDAKSAELAEELHLAVDTYAGCSTSLDESTAQQQQLRAELVRQGKNVDELLSTKGVLASSLAQAKARLEELRKAQVATEARAALFRDLALRLRRMVDAGDLEIKLRSGRMVLALPTDVLFDSGHAKLSQHGREALMQLGSVLTTFKERRFQVAGHTDSDPIRYSGFESNWELSNARALAVVKVMVESGVSPSMLSSAGYAEFDPVAANDTAERKAKNRRIELTLQPNIDELVAVPQAR